MNHNQPKVLLKKWASRIIGRVLVPLAPSRIKLPLLYRTHMLQAPEHDTIRLFNRLGIRGGRDSVCVDAGANIGLFSYALGRAFSTVMAFEPNTALTCPLAAYNSRKVKVISKALSSRTGEATLLVPVVNRMSLGGWGSLHEDHFLEADKFEHKLVELTTLDSYRIKKLSFLKIDVEGHEMDVLEGATQTIKHHRPVVLLEVQQHNDRAVTQFFESFNYKSKRLEELCGINGDGRDFLFAPAEGALARKWQ